MEQGRSNGISTGKQQQERRAGPQPHTVKEEEDIEYGIERSSEKNEKRNYSNSQGRKQGTHQLGKELGTGRTKRVICTNIGVEGGKKREYKKKAATCSGRGRGARREGEDGKKGGWRSRRRASGSLWFGEYTQNPRSAEKQRQPNRKNKGKGGGAGR